MTQESVRVPISDKKIQGLYDFLSSAYDLVTRYERSSQDRALEVANARENSVVLDVRCGTGKTLVEFAKKAANNGEVYGLDSSQRMMGKAKTMLVNRRMLDRVHMVLGDATHMPFRDASLDIVFSGYMPDLIDTPAIPKVLSEFKRLLKPSGRLVLVSLSKGSKWYDNIRLYEWSCRQSPALFEGCRPAMLKPCLQQLGFKNVNRDFMHAGHLRPSEIVWVDKNN